jgi:circadian clock protein KaiC
MPALAKAPTGITGLDETTGGGFPRGRATLIEGGPGCGKTILALQSLVNGALLFNEPGIFVAFEESPTQIMANVANFGWDLADLQRRKLLFFLDARPDSDLIQSGDFDLTGMLLALDAKADEIKAQRIVFDAVDIVLTLLSNPRAERREIYRLHDWLLARQMTALITCKRAPLTTGLPQELGSLQFMVDCAVILRQEVGQSISQRNLRVLKYRGSAFDENESPFVIGPNGLDIASRFIMDRKTARVSNRRVSSGVKRLDKVLGGGYYAESSVLITGAPGTAKSTLGGAFLEAACKRGERGLFISFDSDSSQVVRNLLSVNIHLDRFLKNGLLRVVGARSLAASGEIHLLHIKRLAREHDARCVVVDPVSALAKSGNAMTVHSVSERLLDWAKSEKITLLCTSLYGGSETGKDPEIGSLPISTISDTWIHLSYVIHSGERNRSLSVVKSRGTWHSNQVRELVLSAKGVTLTDAYTAGGEVLMGTLRWEKERSEEIAALERKAAARRKHVELVADKTELEMRLKVLQRQIEARDEELAILQRVTTATQKKAELDRRRLNELRAADTTESKDP